MGIASLSQWKWSVVWNNSSLTVRVKENGMTPWNLTPSGFKRPCLCTRDARRVEDVHLWCGTHYKETLKRGEKSIQKFVRRRDRNLYGNIELIDLRRKSLGRGTTVAETLNERERVTRRAGRPPPSMFGKGGQGPTAQAKPTSCWVASLGVTSGIQGVPQSTRVKTGVCLHEGKCLGQLERSERQTVPKGRATGGSLPLYLYANENGVAHAGLASLSNRQSALSFVRTN